MSYLDRFYESLASNEVVAAAFRASSVSDDDAIARLGEYEKTFSNLDTFSQLTDRNYSAIASQTGGHPGVSDAGLHGIDFFDATVSAAIKSYANLFSVEKNMNNPDASLPYFNVYGVKSNKLVTPNLGPSLVFTEAESDFEYMAFYKKANLTTFKFGPSEVGDFKLNSIPMIPNRLLITVKELDGVNVGTVWVINDNGQGDLIAKPGFVTSGSVDYGHTNNIPGIEFEINATLIQATEVEVSVRYVEDTPKEQLDRLKPTVEYYQATSAPVIVPYEINQLTAMAVQKSLGLNMREFILNAVTDEYTKIINMKTAAGVQATASNHAERVIDLSGYSLAAGNHKSLIESFLVQLGGLDTAISQKNEKVNYVTGFLGSIALGDVFKNLDTTTERWKANKLITYIDDVCGYLDGIPVVRTKHIKDVNNFVLQGYATHKTREGQLAPLMRGMFLPLTSMNEVGSFDNALIKTGGIFSYEGVSPLTNELTIGFQVKVNPVGTIIGK